MVGQNKSCYVVGIGASAGGLESLNYFFNNLSDSTGMAFVVIQHLAPDHDSHMVNLLAKHTAMDVCQAEDGMEVESDSIYLIPPNHNLTIFKDQLYLAPRTSNKYNLNLPIDIFFESLAEDKRDKAIGIVLSGTGSDGTRGIRAIKDYNGLVMAQNEASAKFSAMPNNAVATGLVDYVLHPKDMGESLLEYTDHFHSNKVDVPQEEAPADNKLDKVLAIIKNELDIDFTYYKDNTIVRRLERRMAINQTEDIDDYIELLETTSGEVETLYRELLIGVTKFFRDKEAFAQLEEEVIPEIIANKSNGDEIRVWVPACSTGEEVYSLAILFKEYIEAHQDDFRLKIFATDISQESIKKASIGEYPESIAGEIEIERLQKYFIKQGNSYRISKEIRELTIFSVHNIIEDPPFHKIDLISCRNLLIYFEKALQQKVLALFHFSLLKDGFLLLGSSESIGEMDQYFSTYNSKWRIYQYIERSEKPAQLDLMNNLGSSNLGEMDSSKTEFSSPVDKSQQIDNITQAVLTECLGDTAIIDKDDQIVHVIGDLNPYLQLSVGKLSLDILDMADEDLAMVLGIAINKVKRDNDRIVYNNVEVNREGGPQKISLAVTPLQKNLTDKFLAITFKDSSSELGTKAGTEIDINNEEQLRERIKDLERELGYTKEDLQATIEELEASNEELQATNEELMASNEELQSTNEELESVNEELVTVNTEHQNKIEELTQLNNDMDNLLRSTDIGTIFLDNQLRIRKFTPAIKDNINLIDSDIDRPLSHISHNIEYDNLLEDAQEVLETLVPKEIKVKTEDGSWYLMKVLPYRTEDDKIRGIVITFVDVSALKVSEQKLQKLSYVVQESPNLIVFTDLQGQIEYVNNKFSQITGYQKEEVLGESTSILKSGEMEEELYQELWETITAGEKWSGQLYNRTKHGEYYWEQATIFPIKDETEEIINYIKIASLKEEKNG
ncbi:MAG: chemotaxis protein CheB [Bacillota bacterium]